MAGLYTAEEKGDLWRQLTQRHRDLYLDPSIGGDDPAIHFEHHLRKGPMARNFEALVPRSRGSIELRGRM